MSVLLLGLMFTLPVTTRAAGLDSSTEISCGLGIPYGVAGGNFELKLQDKYGLCAGLGVSKAGAAWSVGGRFYFDGEIPKIQQYVGLYYGTVTIRETQFFNASSTYDNIKGSAAGYGIDYQYSQNITLNGEFVYIVSQNDSGEPDSRYKISIGIRTSPKNLLKFK